MTKTLKTSNGSIEINTPRDRAGSFEPKIIKKRQTILNEGLDNKILGLFSIGMSYKDIRQHMYETYGTEISQGMLTKITDKLLPTITEWRSRPLESVYTIVFLVILINTMRDPTMTFVSLFVFFSTVIVRCV